MIDVSEDGCGTRSEIAFQDVFLRIQKDFKHNLALLKIRETEIERCTRTNRTLQETLMACLSANAELKTRISMLENSLERAEADRVKGNEIHRRNLAALTRTLGEAMRERDISRKDRETHVRKRVLEIEKNYVEILNRKQEEFDRKIEELQNKFEAENLTVAKVTKQLEICFEESTQLRNKLRETQSKYTREVSDYRQELNTVENRNNTLISKLASVEAEAKRRRLNDENAKEKLRDHVREIERELGGKIDALTMENKSLKKSNSRLNLEVLTLKNSDVECGDVAPSADEEGNCYVGEHNRFPVLLQQNEVLQEIVKTMRKEREILTRKQTEELKSAEQRVDKLERYIDSLKQATLSKVQIKNLISVNEVNAVENK